MKKRESKKALVCLSIAQHMFKYAHIQNQTGNGHTHSYITQQQHKKWHKIPTGIKNYKSLVERHIKT